MKKIYLNSSKKKITFLSLIIAGITFWLLLIGARSTLFAQEDSQDLQGPPIHPQFPLLDADGNLVIDSGEPLSTMRTCGACHDTEFIASHSSHVDVGLNEISESGQQVVGQPWDISPGLFGKWNPITYNNLSAEGDEHIDLTTADWIKRFGARHVGGGPAETSREGISLLDLVPGTDSVETSTVDAETGQLMPWNWQESGVVEMNCFLCHWNEPNNEERINRLQGGKFSWAGSATLLGSGIINETDGQLEWNKEAFDSEGNLLSEYIQVQDPTNQNCGQCHGLVHVEAQTPTELSGCSADQWSTITTGQIMSPQKINQSGINISDKQELTRSWDIHTERVVNCVDCHYSLNNPVYYEENEATRPEHLVFDPRRIDLGEYLYRPIHEFAKGQSTQGTLTPEFDNTLRRCESCHEASNTHDWLPYTDRHLQALSCESCHIPKMYAPARGVMDWTVLNQEGVPYSECRGVEGDGPTMASVLVTGFEPVLLPRESADGDSRLAPHNLISSWYWVYGEAENTRPVLYRDLQEVWASDNGNYDPEIMSLFDENGDGLLDEAELVINSDEKEALIAGMIADLGYNNPRIEGETRAYSISHNVTHGEWATKDCQTCHTEDSRLSAAMYLSDRMPGGVMPTFIGGNENLIGENIIVDEAGKLNFQPNLSDSKLYVLGHTRESHVDLLGALLLLGTVFGVGVHSGMRFFAARRQEQEQEPEIHEVYMYSIYDRLWHWLQTAVIFILLFTGLIIHKPETFGIFRFPFVVQVHNIMAFLLVANAFLALFYNLASGDIKRFLPEPKGFFNQAILQAKYYLQGIFQGAEHPFEKTPEQRLNPLQQITYFGLLNVLLPLQVITGALMWGMQHWPNFASQIGGLTYLAPLHTLVSWLLASFIVLHVYLTTTAGPTVTSGVKSMIMGWDEVEEHQTSPVSTD
jgi:thiosulfate reductase cytochrome b subunit